MTPRNKAQKKEYDKIYCAKPEMKLRKKIKDKARNSLPEIKEKTKKNNKEYTSKPEVKEKINLRLKKYRAGFEIRTRIRAQQLKHKFNITLEDYNKIFNVQNGCCAICNKPQSDFDKPLFVDHNHETNKIRGLLCRSCNLLLGYSKDNIDILTQAIQYLKND